MKLFLIFILSSFVQPLWAESFVLVGDEIKTKIEVLKFNDIHLSKSCFERGAEPNCDAYLVLSKKFKHTRTLASSMANPAVLFCDHVGGQSRVIKNNVSTEFDYCEFKDKSMIDAWDLYLHFHTKRTS